MSEDNKQHRYIGIDPPLVEFVDESQADYTPGDDEEYEEEYGD